MNFPPRRRQPPPDNLAARQDPYNVTNASRIYFLPNLMTAGNLFCGFVAVIQCVQARLAETATTGDYLGGSPADHYRQAVWLFSAQPRSTRSTAGSRAWVDANRSSARSSIRWRM